MSVHVWRTMAACVMLLIATDLGAQNAPSAPSAEAYFPNVVSIRTGNQQGFGFIVGLKRDTALIATPLHVVESADEQTLQVCFAPRGATCAKASVSYIADAIGQLPALDLAFLSVPVQRSLLWRPDVQVMAPKAGDPVVTIGRSGEWYVPPTAGRVTNATSPTGSFSYSGLDVMSGVSGAPVFSGRGFVGMHTQGRGTAGADGILLDAIRNRLEAFAPNAWALVPPADCAGNATEREALAGRDVVVRFQSSSQRRALEAAAKFTCVGAIVQIAPQRAGETWSGAGVLYPPGELTRARAAQSLLSDLGRLPGILGASGGAIEVRIP